MPARQGSNSNLPAAVSVTEMASRVGLSCSRFYELIREGFFPMPVYGLKSRRPMYLTEQIVECMKARRSSVGANGEYVLFYSPRQEPETLRPPRSAGVTGPPAQLHVEILDGLRALGLTATTDEVAVAVRSCFPEGIAGKAEGEVLRACWTHIRSSNVG